MRRDRIGLKNTLQRHRVDLLSLKKIVDLLIGNAVGILVRPERRKVLEVRGQDLADKLRSSTKCCAKARTRRLFSPERGRTSAAPSPNLVKKPISASAA
jgi:hypothetical protein